MVYVSLQIHAIKYVCNCRAYYSVGNTVYKKKTGKAESLEVHEEILKNKKKNKWKNFLLF